jgi:hypothetical protein
VNDPVELKVFHYHYLTGGVTTVVRQALEAFHSHLPRIRSVELVAGVIPEDFTAHREGCYETCVQLPEIGYRQEGDEPFDNDKKYVAREATRLAEVLLRSFGSDDSVWWIHNYHLGKNVVFTQALLEIIHSGRPQRMILQIHDFPECGRFRNLSLLRQALTLDPYPLSPWVRYAVLNRRDREILISSGLPEQAVFLLENPVLRGPDPGRNKAVRPVLKRLFGAEFPRYDPVAPLLLYPIRTIRRKNALEALLLCLLLDRGANILITLPGTSVSERPYSGLVKGLFADRLCPGLWGIGSQLVQRALSFDDLVAASDLVLSTSVQEGFGYLFINSLLWSLPLAARDLDTLSGLREDLFKDYPAYFYDSIRVPVPDTAPVVEAYRSKIKELSPLIPRADQERLLAGIEELVQEEKVDFSFLPVEAQERLLREIAAADGPEREFCRTENRVALSRIEELLEIHIERESATVNAKKGEVDRRFGACAYSAGFQRILDSFGFAPEQFGRDSPGRRPHVGEEVAQRVLKSFLNLDQLRLLYDF